MDKDLTPRRWAELEGIYNGKRAILRIAPDPNNLGAPTNGVCARTVSPARRFPAEPPRSTAIRSIPASPSY